MKKVFLSLLAITMFAFGLQAKNTITVTGKVTESSTGNPVEFVSVAIKGTSKGLLTDEFGSYSIQVPADSSAVLVFSFVGYETVEEPVNGRTIIDVALKDAVTYLDEVVVSGYAVQRKATIAASVSTVSPGRPSRKERKAAEQAYKMQYSAPQLSYNSLNEEEYASFSSNAFISPLQEALSTFSIDVDAASYANMRRFVNNGQLPPKDAIRSEELINYFKYSYPQPAGEHPISITTELASCPWNKEHKLVHIGLKAKEIPLEELPASHLVFLVDVSGSMSDYNRLPYVQQSLKMLLKQLRKEDKVSLITYSGREEVLLTAVSGSDKKKVEQAIDKLYASGATAGAKAIQTAYKVAKENFIKGGNNRIVMATDGDFNVGVSSVNELEKLIEQERKSGVYFTALGYGMGNYKDNRLQTLAQKGNGNHAYIDNITEAEKVLVTEFAGSMHAIAKDVKIQVEFNPAKVQAYRLIGYETRLLDKEDFNDDTKDAGEMGVGHTVTALYEVVPVGVKSNLLGNVDELKYQKNASKPSPELTNSPELLTLKLRYKPIDSEESKKLEVAVLDKGMSFSNASEDFRFAAAVAEVGMLLHESPYKGNATYDSAMKLARGAFGEDEDGNRHEFVKLVKSMAAMKE